MQPRPVASDRPPGTIKVQKAICPYTKVQQLRLLHTQATARLLLVLALLEHCIPTEDALLR